MSKARNIAIAVGATGIVVGAVFLLRKSKEYPPEPPPPDIEPPAPGTAVLWGIVTDAETGWPIADVIVYESFANLLARTDSDGYYELRDIPPGDYQFAFSEEHGRYEAKIVNVALEADQIKQVSLTLTPIVAVDKAVLQGTVTESVTGNPIHGYDVTLDGYATSTSPLGYYRIENIEPGTYVIAVSDFLSDPRHETWTGEVTLIAGEVKTLDIVMTPVPGEFGPGFILSITNYPQNLQWWNANAKDKTWDYDPIMDSGWLAPTQHWDYPSNPMGVTLRVWGYLYDDFIGYKVLFDFDVGPVEDGHIYEVNVQAKKLIDKGTFVR